MVFLFLHFINDVQNIQAQSKLHLKHLSIELLIFKVNISLEVILSFKELHQLMLSTRNCQIRVASVLLLFPLWPTFVSSSSVFQNLINSTLNNFIHTHTNTYTYLLRAPSPFSKKFEFPSMWFHYFWSEITL